MFVICFCVSYFVVILVVFIYLCDFICFFFFFFKQKTADDMRISDWSSDVCSSDLAVERRDKADRQRRAGHQQYRECKHGFSSEPVAQRSPEQSAQRPHEKGYRECRQREQGRLACGAGEQSCGYIGQAIGIDARKRAVKGKRV